MVQLDRRSLLKGVAALGATAAFGTAGEAVAQAATALPPGVTNGKYPNFEKLIAHAAQYAHVIVFADDGHDEADLSAPLRDLGVTRALKDAKILDSYLEFANQDFGPITDRLSGGQIGRQQFVGFLLEERLKLLRKMFQDKTLTLRDDRAAVRKIEGFADITIAGRENGVRTHAADPMGHEAATRLAFNIATAADPKSFADLFQSRLSEDRKIAEFIKGTMRQKGAVFYGAAHSMLKSYSNFFNSPKYNIDDALRDMGFKTVVIHISNDGGKGFSDFYKIVAKDPQHWDKIEGPESADFMFNESTGQITNVSRRLPNVPGVSMQSLQP